MNKKSLKYNFVMNCILKMSAFVFPLITFPYLSRVLGAEMNGKISFADSFISYFVMIASLGIPTYGIMACTRCRDNKEKLSKTVQELLIISLAMTFVSYILLVVIMLGVPQLSGRSHEIMLFSVEILLSSIGMEWFYQSVEEYGYITFRNIFFKIISIVLMFLFVHKKDDYLVYIAIIVFGTAGSNFLNLIKARRYVSFGLLKKYDLLPHLKPIGLLAIFSIASRIYNSLDTVMIGFLSNDTQVGYYNASVKMKNILVSVVTALGTVILPRVAYYIEKKMEKEFTDVLKKSFSFVFFMAIPVTLFFVIEAKDSILLLAGEGYIDAVLAMQVIVPTVIFIGLTNIIGIQVLIPLKLERYTVISTIAGAVIDLLLNSILIPRYGALGAAIGTLVAEMVVLFVQLISVIRMKKRNYIQVEKINLMKIVIASIFASLVLRVSNCYLYVPNVLVRFVVSASFFWTGFIIICLVTKEKILNSILISIIRRIR